MEKDIATEQTAGKIKPKTTEEKDVELRVYEASYLLLPLITEDDLSKEAGHVKESVALSGGAIFSEEMPSLIKLAYEMVKVIANKNTRFDHAYFGWMKFESEPESLSKIKKALEANENILRFLILKTVKENAMPKKSVSFSPKPSMKISAPMAETKIETPAEPIRISEKIAEKPVVVPQEIDEAELDKTIDDLVIE